MDHPIGQYFVSVDPANPKGVHLLFLVAGSLPPDIAEKVLIDRLGRFGKPPDDLPAAWSQLRGGGAVRKVKTRLQSSYLAEIEQSLPDGLEPMHALFLPTVKEF